jgi:hypothetical protein
MTGARILVFAGPVRAASDTARLVALAAKLLAIAERHHIFLQMFSAAARRRSRGDVGPPGRAVRHLPN